MHIAIFGASRPMGAQAAALALQRGHTVSVVSRSGASDLAGRAGVSIVKGDATVEGDVRSAVEKADAVLSFLGGGMKNSKDALPVGIPWFVRSCILLITCRMRDSRNSSRKPCGTISRSLLSAISEHRPNPLPTSRPCIAGLRYPSTCSYIFAVLDLARYLMGGTFQEAHPRRQTRNGSNAEVEFAKEMGRPSLRCVC